MATELKPYPTYKDSGVEWLGAVPAHWEVRQLGRVGRFFKGNGGTKEDDAEHGVPCIRYGDLYTHHRFFITESRSCVAPETAAAAYTPLRYGDVLFAGSGETIDEIGKSAVNMIPGRACCGGDVIIFRPAIEVEARFLGYATDSRSAAWQKACMGRGITVMHIYGSELKYLTVALPPPSEQAAIVRFLDHADRRIRRYIRAKEKLIALLEEERMVGTLEALQSTTAANQRLGTVSDLLWRRVDRRDDREYTPLGLYNRGRGIFRKEARSGGELGDSDFSWVKEGDLVVSGQFAWEGAIALAGVEEDGCVASHRYPILRGKPGRLETGFLLAFLQTDWGSLLLDHHSRGAAGRNRPLNAKALMKENVALPALRSQCRVAKMLDREFAAREYVGRLAARLSEYRTRLIADVVTGKVDVREAATGLPDLEPPAAEENSVDDLTWQPGAEARADAKAGRPLSDLGASERRETVVAELGAEGRWP